MSIKGDLYQLVYIYESAATVANIFHDNDKQNKYIITNDVYTKFSD